MPAAYFSYDRGQRAFHWWMAAVILIAFALGVWAHSMPPKTPLRVELLFWHKSLGFAAIALLPFRLVWRAVRGEPVYRAPLAPPVRIASHVAHGALYALMAALPIAGYVASAAGGYPLSFFGLFEWPRAVGIDKDLSKAAGEAHYWLSWAMAAVLALHIAAVAWHRWIKRDEVLARMTGDAPAADRAA